MSGLVLYVDRAHALPRLSRPWRRRSSLKLVLDEGENLLERLAGLERDALVAFDHEVGVLEGDPMLAARYRVVHERRDLARGLAVNADLGPRLRADGRHARAARAVGFAVTFENIVVASSAGGGLRLLVAGAWLDAFEHVIASAGPRRARLCRPVRKSRPATTGAAPGGWLLFGKAKPRR